MTRTPRDIVAAGYDALADRYGEWAGRAAADPRESMLARFVSRLPAGASILDLGCGNGLPSTAALAERFEVTGVDTSASQLEAARRNAPRASFVQADLTDVDFPAASFDAAVALYSISHVPREEHSALFGRVFQWLRPEGLFLATLGARDAPDWTGEWLGVTMFFSAYDADTNRRLLRASGFELLVDEVAVTREPEADVAFLWVIARRPQPTG